MSAGFDAHRDDPLTELGLTAADFAALTARAMALVPAGRTVAMLEGGYDLEALAACTDALLGVLAGGAAAHRRRRAGHQRRPRRTTPSTPCAPIGPQRRLLRLSAEPSHGGGRRR